MVGSTEVNIQTILTETKEECRVSSVSKAPFSMSEVISLPLLCCYAENVSLPELIKIQLCRRLH